MTTGHDGAEPTNTFSRLSTTGQMGVDSQPQLMPLTSPQSRAFCKRGFRLRAGLSLACWPRLRRGIMVYSLAGGGFLCLPHRLFCVPKDSLILSLRESKRWALSQIVTMETKSFLFIGGCADGKTLPAKYPHPVQIPSDYFLPKSPICADFYPDAMAPTHVYHLRRLVKDGQEYAAYVLRGMPDQEALNRAVKGLFGGNI